MTSSASVPELGPWCQVPEIIQILNDLYNGEWEDDWECRIADLMDEHAKSQKAQNPLRRVARPSPRQTSGVKRETPAASQSSSVVKKSKLSTESELPKFIDYDSDEISVGWDKEPDNEEATAEDRPASPIGWGNPTCWGCRYERPGQRDHMEEGGCLYQGSCSSGSDGV